MRSTLGRALWLAALAHLVIELSNTFLPVLYPVVMPRMGLSFTQVGVVAFVATTAMALAQPLFGVLSDRWGADRLMSLSVIWIGVVMGLVGFAGSYPLLLTLIALGSLGSAAFHPAAAVISAAASGAKRGAGLSIFSVGGNIGSALSPLWMGVALAAVGLAGTTSLIPLGIGMGILCFVTLRHVRRSAAPTRPAARPAAPAAGGFLAGLVLVVVAMMFRSWYQVALSTYLPTWIEQNGGSVVLGGRILFWTLFAVSAGSLIGGPLGDRVGHWQVVIASSAAMSAALWFYLQASGWSQYLWLLVAGLAIGATYPTSIVLALESWPHQIGLASGLLMGVGWWPGGIGAAVVGYLADHYSLGYALESLVFAPLVTVVCILVYAVVVRQRRPLLAGTAKP
jgi:FSR family fosmidomycin resistance protein-like MFS transporter